MKPKIGITRKHTGKHLQQDNTYLRYHDCVSKAGGEPVDLLPTETPAEQVIRDLKLSGIVLSGGGDLDPKLYKEDDHSAQNIDNDRDRFELDLLRTALQIDLPLFAICRGAQMLNVGCGGSLVQDIARDKYRRHAGPNHTSEYHDVRLVKPSRLGSLLGKELVQVNSRHHQGITPERLGDGLVATAFAANEDIVEAIEAPNLRWVVGVQWHPERVDDKIGNSFQVLFDDFVRSAAKTAAGGMSRKREVPMQRLANRSHDWRRNRWCEDNDAKDEKRKTYQHWTPSAHLYDLRPPGTERDRTRVYCVGESRGSRARISNF